MDRDALIKINELDISFPREKTRLHVIQDFTLEILSGEFVCILGPSGCGKTTLLKILAGLNEPDAGTVEIMISSDDSNSPVTLVFQDFALFPWRTVRKNIEFPLEMKGVVSDQRQQISTKLIDLVNLEGFETAHPKELSGGMKQRVAIARALATEAQVLLMDEPFGSLDAQTRNLMQSELLDIWKKTGKTIVFVTHSVDESVFLADRIVVMTSRPGRVREIIDVPLKRPRDRTSRDFIEIRAKVLEELQEEFEKTRIMEKAGLDRSRPKRKGALA